MKKVVIIGGGASGLVAAIYAARNGNDVTVLERNSDVGKKILITGNGKCNYFNEQQNISYYHSSDSHLLSKVINPSNLSEVLNLFDEIGIVPKIKNDFYYPNSNQAVSVKEALLFECKMLGVNIVCDYLVTNICKFDDKFVINDNLIFDKAIIATGGKAFAKTGSDGMGYDFARNFGHCLVKPLPALVQLICDKKFKLWNGVRCDVDISLFENDKFVRMESGEIQLTDYGVSGICVLNLSGHVARGLDCGKKEYIVINFLPNISDFDSFIYERSKKLKGRNIGKLFDGLLNYKLADVLLKEAGISKSKFFDELSSDEVVRLCKTVTCFGLNIVSTNSFDRAQVCSGGVPLSSVNLDTMESKMVKNLFFVGEILDVYGDCGGYNLTFAWVSGILAGRGCL